MRRRDCLELALGALVIGAVAPLVPGGAARADCAVPIERAAWLRTNVHAGGAALVWLGQPRGVPVPSELELIASGASTRAPITWIVPGVARVSVPPSTTGSVEIVAPPRAPQGASERLSVSIAAGPSPARLSAPPADLRLTREAPTLRWGDRGDVVRAQFRAAPPGTRLVVARWAGVGNYADLAAGATDAVIYALGPCGGRPVDGAAPARGAPIEIAFVDDEGNVSSFVRATTPA